MWRVRERAGGERRGWTSRAPARASSLRQSLCRFFLVGVSVAVVGFVVCRCVCCCVGGSPPSFLTVITTTTTNIIIATSSSSSLTWYAKRKKASAELRRPSRKTLGVGERRRRMLDGRMARMVAARLIMNSCKPMPKTSARFLFCWECVWDFLQVLRASF